MVKRKGFLPLPIIKKMKIKLSAKTKKYIRNLRIFYTYQQLKNLLTVNRLKRRYKKCL